MADNVFLKVLKIVVLIYGFLLYNSDLLCSYSIFDCSTQHYYAHINRARGLYEEIFVLTFEAYEPNEVRFIRLECQNKFFPYGPKSRLIRALLYTYTNKIIFDEIIPS